MIDFGWRGGIFAPLFMKIITLLILLTGMMTLSPYVHAQAQQVAEEGVGDETEKEWAVLSHHDALNKVSACFKTIKAASLVKYKYEQDTLELQRISKVLSQKKEVISAKDLLGLRKVRSIQIGRLGVFKYPYFICKFKQKEEGLFFEKTTGSQRKSGIVFADEPTQMVFLGGWSVNENPQKPYSGLVGSKVTEYDSVGVFVKRGGRILAVFPKGPQSYEVYEFSK